MIARASTIMLDHTCRESEISAAVLPALVHELRASHPQPFCLWLRGDLGAGKTTFAGYLLHALGLADDVPVLSPTFTYMTEYTTSSGLIAHLDLYRLIDGDLDSVSTLLAERAFSGLIVEWPERCSTAPEIKPTHILDISFVADDDLRHYRLGAII